MGLETATYLNDLVSTNPLGSDAKSVGDDHLRLIKKTLKNSLNGFTGPVVVTGTDVGSANNYAITLTPALASYVSGMMVLLKPSASNTTSSTINISSLGTKAIKSVEGSALTSGDLAVGSSYLMVYDGTDFRIINGPTKNYVDQLSFSSSLPGQAGNGGYYLTTDGATASWDNLKSSPAFTGTPTSPTAAVDTSTTQLATTAFVVNQAYAKLAGPTFTGNVTVPTLAADATSELAINAAWYGGQAGTANPAMDGTAAAGTSKKWSPIDHVHPTDTSLAPLASPTFTGTPAAPTAAVNTNTTQLATTAFVVAQIADDVASASQAQMEAASSTTVFATPGNVNWHPGVAKSWIRCDAAGNISSSHNVSSISDVGVGDVRVFFTTSMSSGNSSYIGTGIKAAGTNARIIVVYAGGTGGISANSYDAANVLADPDYYMFTAFGDQ